MADISQWTQPTSADLEVMRRRLTAAITEIQAACQRRLATSTSKDSASIVSILIDDSGRGKINFDDYRDDSVIRLTHEFESPVQLARFVLGVAEVPEVPYVNPQAN